MRPVSDELDFADRFAIFADQLGDLLELLIARGVDALERFFSLDPQQQAAALAHIPRRRVSAAEARGGVGGLQVSTCPVCLSDLRRGEEVRLLPGCQHVFHSRCADGWLSRQGVCPCCRASVLPGGAAAATALAS